MVVFTDKLIVSFEAQGADEVALNLAKATLDGARKLVADLEILVSKYEIEINQKVEMEKENE